MGQLPDVNWEKAKAHFDEVKANYEEIDGMPGVNVRMALDHVFAPLEYRYDSGERTSELYDAMMGTE